MSRYDKQLRKSIQRIVLDSPALTNALDAYANRGGFGAAVGSAASDAEESRLCCDGSTGDPNPGTSERDPDASSQDGLDPNDPAKLTNGEGSLTGLTDCATGEPVCMDGAGFIPPDDWDAPDDPPIDPTYTEGMFWYLSCIADLVVCESVSPIKGDPAQSGCEWRHVNCGVTGCDTTEACNPAPEDILVNGGQWPSDDCVNLAIKDGTIVGSKYDPDQSGAYSVPMDEIQLCDDQGNQISLSPSASGGWKTIDAINGGDGYLYDSSGTQIARISADEYSDPNV